MISAGTFRLSLTLWHCFLNILKKFPYVKNYGNSKNTEKTGHPPLKKLIIEKNDLLHDKVTSRHQIFVVGKAYSFLGVRAKRIPKKPVHNEKTKKKQKKIGVAGGTRTRELRALCKSVGSAAYRYWKLGRFLYLSRAHWYAGCWYLQGFPFH